MSVEGSRKVGGGVIIYEAMQVLWHLFFFSSSDCDDDDGNGQKKREKEREGTAEATWECGWWWWWVLYFCSKERIKLSSLQNPTLHPSPLFLCGHTHIHTFGVISRAHFLVLLLYQFLPFCQIWYLSISLPLPLSPNSFLHHPPFSKFSLYSFPLSFGPCIYHFILTSPPLKLGFREEKNQIRIPIRFQ